MIWAHRFLGIALLASAFAGCAATPDFITSQLWPWRQEEDASGLTADLSRPFPPAPLATTEVARPSEFDFSHPLIDRQAARFQGEQRGFFERALARSARYVPVMQTILEKHGVPPQLAYLPLIESGYHLNAVSPAGAVGPWQFIRGTGLRYGLRIDRNVDERRDPIKSTEAAAKYLRDLYDMFEDWHLALAAYNTGEGNVGRILENKGVESYWDMIGKGWLYAETEAYVPRFLAALQMAENAEVYGFDSPDPDPIAYDWVRVNKPLALAKVAALSGSNINQIKELNPALRSNSVPQSGYIVKLPKGTKRAYQVAADKVDPDVTAYNPEKPACETSEGVHCVQRGETVAVIAAKYNISGMDLINANNRRLGQRLKAGDVLIIPGKGTPVEPPVVARRHRSRPAIHTVRRGETIGVIAKRYGVNEKRLLQHNRIRNPRALQIGQKLAIPGSVKLSASAAGQPSARATTHVVRKGDTPATIARRYGVTTKAVLQANNIRDSRGLQIGRKLRIPGAAPARTAKAAAPQLAKSAPEEASEPVLPSDSTPRVHRLRKGETVGLIAQRYGVSVQTLLKHNRLSNPRSLQIGQRLVIPAGSTKSAKAASAPAKAPSANRTHVIRKGDTPASIAAKHNISVQALMKANNIRDARRLRLGQTLKIPASQRVLARKPGTKS